LTLWTPLKAADDFDCCLVCDFYDTFSTENTVSLLFPGAESGADVYRHRCQFQSFSERSYFLGDTDINSEACRTERQLFFFVTLYFHNSLNNISSLLFPALVKWRS